MKAIKLFLAFVLSFTTCFSNGLIAVHAENALPEDLAAYVDPNGTITIATSDTAYLDAVTTNDHSKYAEVVLEWGNENEDGNYDYYRSMRNYDDGDMLSRDYNGYIVFTDQNQRNWGILNDEPLHVSVMAEGYPDYHAVVYPTHSVSRAFDSSVEVSEQGNLVITSDETYLANITTVYYENTDTSKSYEMNSDSQLWGYHVHVSGNQIVVDAEAFSAMAFKSGEYQIRLDSPVYQSAYAGTVYLSVTLPQPPAFSVTETSDGIVISSENQNWIENIHYVTFSSDNYDRTYSNVEGEDDIFIEMGYAIIQRETLNNKELFDDVYTVTVESTGFDDAYITYEIANGITPSTVTVGYDRDHGLVITSDQQVFVENLSYIEITLGNSSVEVDMSKVAVSGNTASVPVDHLNELGVSGNVYGVNIRTYGYGSEKNLLVTIPDASFKNVDVELTVDDNGDLVITADDQEWIDRMFYGEYVDEDDCYHDASISIDSSNRITFSNFEGEGPIQLVDNQLVISSDELKRSHVANGYADVYFYLPDYDYFSVSVEITGGVVVAPSDLTVYVDEATGDLVISTDDTNYLENLILSNDGDESSIEFNLATNHYEIRNDDDEYVEDKIILEDGVVKVTADVQRKMGFINGPAEIVLTASGYAVSSAFNVTLTQAGFDTPEFSLYFDENTRELVIVSDDNDWLEALVAPYVGGTGYGYGVQFGGPKYDFIGNVNGLEDLVLYDGEVRVSANALRRNLESGNYYVTIKAMNYAYTMTEEIYLEIESLTYPEDARIVVKENGDLCIYSSDHAWLENILLDPEHNDYRSGIRLYNEAEDRNYYLANFPRDTQIEYLDNGISISSSHQQQRGIANGTYTIEVLSLNYATLESTVTLTHGSEPLPLDLTVSVDDDGNLIIATDDQVFIQKMLVGSYDTEDGYVDASISFDAEDANGRSLSNYEWNQNRLYLVDGKLFVPVNVLKSNNILKGNNIVSFYVTGYSRDKAFEITLTEGSERYPDDVEIVVDSENGNIVISTSNQEFKQNLYDGYEEYEMGYQDSYVGFYNEQFNESHSNNEEKTFIMWSGEDLVITPQAQRRIGLPNGTIEISLNVYGFEAKDESYGINITHGVLSHPEDIEVTIDEQGNLIVSSEDRAWLESIVVAENYEMGIEPGIVVTNHHDFWDRVANSEYNPGNLILTEEGVVLSTEVQAKYGIANETYYIEINGHGYSSAHYYEVTFTNAAKNAPSDVRVSVNSKTGDIYIDSNDKQWLQEMAGIGIDEDAENTIRLYSEEQNRSYHLWVNQYNQPFKYENGRLIIPKAYLQARGVSNDVYSVSFMASGYSSLNDVAFIQITKGAKAVPSDVQIVADPDTGNLWIKSSDRAWLQGIVEEYDYDNFKYPGLEFNDENGEYYSLHNFPFWDDKPLVLKSEGVFVDFDFILSEGMAAGTYYITVGSVGYAFYEGEVVLAKGAVAAPTDVSVSIDGEGNLWIASENSDWLNKLCEFYEDNAVLIFNNEEGYGNWGFSNNEYNTPITREDGSVKVSAETFINHGLINGEYTMTICVPGCMNLYYDEVLHINGVLPAPTDVEVYQDEFGNLIIASSDDQWLDSIVYENETYSYSLKSFIELGELKGEDEIVSWFVFANHVDDIQLYREDGYVILSNDLLIAQGVADGYYMVNVCGYGYEYNTAGLLELTDVAIKAPTDVKLSTDTKGNITIKTKDTKWLKAMIESESFIQFNGLNVDWWSSVHNWTGEGHLSYKSGAVTVPVSSLKFFEVINGKYDVEIYVPGYSTVRNLTTTIKKSVVLCPEITNAVQLENNDLLLEFNNSSYVKKIEDIVVESAEVGYAFSVMPYVNKSGGNVIIAWDALLENIVPDGDTIYLNITADGYTSNWAEIVDVRGCGEAPEDVVIGLDEHGNFVITSENQDYLDNMRMLITDMYKDQDNVYGELYNYMYDDGVVVFHTGSLDRTDLEGFLADVYLFSKGYTLVSGQVEMVDLPSEIVPHEGRLYVGDELTLEATNLPNQEVAWSTSNKKIATVDKNGVVKFVKAGTVKITGKAYGKTMTIELTCEAITLNVTADVSKPMVGDVVELNVTNSTDRDIIWTVSDEEVVTLNEETLAVEAVGPGSATVSAKINGVTKSVKFTVYTVESGAKLKSKVVDYDKAGMELGEVKTLNIFTDKSEETINEHMKFKSSNTKVATVDEDGNITAIAKGTAKITATVANDPDGRKITVEVKVIDRQARAIEVVIDDEAVERNGNELLIDYEVVGKNYKIVLDEILIDRDGNELTTGVKWSTSDSKVASVKTEKNVNYLVIAGGGQIELTCTASDSRKESVTLTLRVVQYAPRLESSKVSLNTASVEKTEVKLYTAYDTTVSEVRVLEYNKTAKGYIETENFEVELNKGKVNLSAAEGVKKGTYKLKLEVTIDNGRTYGYELSATVAETLPSTGVKVSGYINTFNVEESTLKVALDHKGKEVTGIELDGTEAFTRNFSIDEEGNVEIHGLEKEANGKLTVKGTLRIYYEGYRKPVEKSITFTTKSVKPSWKLSASTIVFSPSGSEVGVTLLDSNKNVVDLTDEQTVELISGSVGSIWIDVDEDKVYFSGMTKSSTVKFKVSDEAWTDALSFSLKLTSSTSLPKAKLASSTMTVHREFAQNAETKVTLDQVNVALSTEEIVLNAVKPNAETEKLQVIYVNGTVQVVVLDNTVKAGTYKYKLTAATEDGIELKAVEFSVKVVSDEPTYKLSKTSIKLNKKLENPEQITMTETLSKNTYNVSVEGIEVRLVKDKKVPAQDVNDVNFVWSEDGIVASLNDTAIKGKYTYYIRPIYEGGVVSSKEVKLTVEVYDKTPTIKTSVSGNLNPIDSASASKVTVTLSNLVDTVSSVELEDERFTAEVVDGKIIVKLAEGTVVTDQTVSLKAHITTATTSTEFDTTLKVKVARSAPKITVSPSTLNMYETSKKDTLVGSVQLTLKGNGEVAEIISQNKESVDAGYRAELRVTEDGTYVDIYLVDAAKVKAGSTTSLKYQVIFKGESNVKKAPSITIKVADKSTSVKWSVIE